MEKVDKCPLCIHEYAYNIFYNAIIQNNCEMDMVNKYVLYLAIVSIKHKATDLMKAMTIFSMATSDADFKSSFGKQRYGVREIIQAK